MPPEEPDSSGYHLADDLAEDSTLTARSGRAI